MPIDPNNKAFVLNQTGVSAGTNVLSANVTPSETPVVWEVTVDLNTSSEMDLTYWNGSAGFNTTIDDGAAIDASQLHNFETVANENLEYNVQFRQDVDVRLLMIDERALEGEN